MVRHGRILAVLAISALALCGGTGAASALTGGSGGGEGIGNGVLSNTGSAGSTGHSALCGDPLSLFSPANCTVGGDRPGSHREGGQSIGGGVLSGVLSWNSTGHSNNCGNALVAAFNQTTCLTGHGDRH